MLRCSFYVMRLLYYELRVLRYALCDYLFNDKWSQGHHASPLDRLGKGSLVLGANPMSLWGINFSLGVHKTTNQIGVFVINLVHFLITEIASFSFHCGIESRINH